MIIRPSTAITANSTIKNRRSCRMRSAPVSRSGAEHCHYVVLGFNESNIRNEKLRVSVGPLASPSSYIVRSAVVGRQRQFRPPEFLHQGGPVMRAKPQIHGGVIKHVH